MNLDKFLKPYDYQIPPELIAQKPASPRDSAELLVYDRKTGRVSFDIFKNVGEYLPKNSVLVFNNTKVIPARLEARKESGGKVEIFYMKTSKGLIEAMTDRKLEIGSKLALNSKIFFSVKEQKEKYYLLRPSFNIQNIFKILEKYGKTPIPPYIKNSPLSEKELKEKYQAVFAKRKGSVAAPTASLHFTKSLINKLKKQGISVKFITLHVNLGTFSPLAEENISSDKLHEEYFEINKKTADFLNSAKNRSKSIIAVGTTSLRALESASDKNGKISKLSGATNLFIREGYKFKFVDFLITNFHVPKSSLLMLVSVLAGRKKLLKLYQKAAAKKFRFFSFGDAMLIK